MFTFAFVKLFHALTAAEAWNSLHAVRASNIVEAHRQREKRRLSAAIRLNPATAAGNSVVPKKVCRPANERIATVVADYQNRTLQDYIYKYLRGVAHKPGYFIMLFYDVYSD